MHLKHIALGIASCAFLVNAYDANSSGNLVAYWGQNSRNLSDTQGNLAQYCLGQLPHLNAYVRLNYRRIALLATYLTD
jgi:hypothetical protein